MSQPLKPTFRHTYTLEMTVTVNSNNEQAIDVTAGDVWAAILKKTDMSDADFLRRVGSPTHTEKGALKKPHLYSVTMAS